MIYKERRRAEVERISVSSYLEHKQPINWLQARQNSSKMIPNSQPGSIALLFLSNKLKLLEAESKNKVKAF